MRISNLKQKILLTVAYVAVLLVVWALKVPCIFQHFLSIPCPGCGMSRAVWVAVQLDFRTAFAYHPMFWSMPILYMYFLVDSGVLKRKWLHAVILGSIGVGFGLNWLIKLVNLSNF